MKQQSLGSKILVDLLKGVVRQLGAPPPTQKPKQQAPAAPLSGCGGCHGRRK